ncbi:MAG: Zn-ribbon domain-containing OB-fold protein [Acidimicrobiaceae bacterium]|nr:Zn-ribbon domain-containing OB-fold protein [Acidimicrobiaceae bacterium]MYH79061.1 Zn-ribbon domain-containing OB-fold protein [Acidimicrobiaceae bacterium]MYK77963.1 Zn-ribbon domain-containing OB-fold protein [Acidimicrobiaceae bacterium]
MTGKPRPDLNDTATTPYWEAAARHELALPCCDGCGLVFFPPRERCPGCWSAELSWQPMSGGGTVWTFTEVHVAFYDDTWADDVPYVVAVIELDEGPRMLAGIVEPDMASLAIGDRVEVTFEDRPEGVTLPVFRVVE